MQPDSEPAQIGPRRLWLLALLPLWLGAAGGGLWVVSAYDNAPGLPASAPDRWPAATSLVRATDGPTLLMLAHPRCSCTAASLGELAEVLARTSTPPRTYVLFLRPESFTDGWEQTDLWRRASRIAGVTVAADDDGREAKRFGVETSGQTLLYDAGGRLVFSGGITGARGHAGDNAGRAGLVALLSRQRPTAPATPVFGCPLSAHGLGS